MILKDKNIIITGSTSGIGYGASLLCNSLGATVWGIGRDTEKLSSLKEICDFPDSMHTIDIDLTSENALGQKSECFPSEVHGIVHSAGISITKPLRMNTFDTYNDTLSVNLYSIARLITILSDAFIHGASIVLISSVMSESGQAAKTSYCASKGGLNAFCRSLALEFAPKRVRVNTILPGVISTPLAGKLLGKLPPESLAELNALHPMGFGTIDDVTQMILFLLSDLSSFITGASIPVDGGYLAR